MYDRSQLMRGTLEGCILQLLHEKVTYGYEIVTRLQQFGFYELKEGTIYPLLLRLEKKQMIHAEYKTSPLGPMRKYYSLTPKGETLRIEFSVCWAEISNTVNAILYKGETEDEP